MKNNHIDKNFKINDTVYTVNGKNNNIDSWTYSGVFRTQEGILAHLVNGKKYCYLPVRCVFKSEDEAKKVANKR